jgi:hypothetical protein
MGNKSYTKIKMTLMKRIISILLMLILLTPLISFGQKSDVADELSDAYDYGKKAKEYAVSTLDYITKCYEQDTLDDVQYYARKAKNEIDYAKTQSGYAESDASDAEDEANDISCDDAEDEADDAEGNFYTAKSRFDDAYTHLSRAEYSDEKDDIEYNLRRAKSYIEEGINYLNYASTDLNDAVDELNECE